MFMVHLHLPILAQMWQALTIHTLQNYTPPMMVQH